MTYLTPDIVNDETSVAEGILTALADRVDGFEPSEGGLVTPISEAHGMAIATAITALKETAQDSYMGFGERILGIPRRPAGVATALSTWTLDTVDGLLIPAGTEVVGTKPDGDTVTFVVPADVSVPAETTTQFGVQLVAVESGPESNGAVGAATADSLIGVASVSIDAPSAGGADAEEPDPYADRLADRAKRLHVLPVTPADYAALALDQPEYVTALALNRYDPASPGTDSPGHMTIVGRNDAGDAVSPANKSGLVAFFASIEMPLSVTVHAADVAYVNVTVAITVKAAADADPATVETNVQAAITALLDKASFDVDEKEPGRWSKIRSTEVTVFDIAAAVDDLAGVVKVTSVTINGGDSVALPAPVSLPNLTAPPTVTVE